MSVNPRGSAFEVYVKRGERRWRITAPTQVSGEMMEKEILAALEAGKEPDIETIKQISSTGKKTLGQVAEIAKRTKWSDSYWGINASRQADFIVAEIGPNKPIEDFDEEDLDALVEFWKSRGNANSTMNRNKAVLSVILTVAEKRGWLKRRIDLEKAKENEGRIRFLDDKEEANLLGFTRHFGHADYADLWVFLMDTGARISEALKLIPRDLSETHATFWETKGGKARTVPMTIRVKEIMKRRGSLERPFPFTYGECRLVWDRVRDHLKMNDDPDWVIHMLRHTCASRLVQRGVPILVVKDWLGHKSIQTTMRYAHLAPTSLDAVVHVLDNRPVNVPVAEQVDAADLKSASFGSAGSSPAGDTIWEEAAE